MTKIIDSAVSFIVPALNEEVVIERVVRDISSEVAPLLERYEIILVNDGSTDRTGELMNRLAADLPNVRVLHHDVNWGLGASYQHGLKNAKFDYVMMLCGDGGLPASSLPPIIEKIGTADIVIPYMLNLRKIKTPSRYIVSRTYTALLNLMSGHKLNYYNGLPVHKRAFLERITIVSSGFGFQGEILIKLLRSGCTYVQVPVNGAEFTNNSSAFRVRNIVNVCSTLIRLLAELRRFSGLDLNMQPRDEESQAAGTPSRPSFPG